LGASFFSPVPVVSAARPASYTMATVSSLGRKAAWVSR